jgi:hypothetical protein
MQFPASRQAYIAEAKVAWGLIIGTLPMVSTIDITQILWLRINSGVTSLKLPKQQAVSALVC